jgi:stage II sporulation protein D
MIDRLSTGFRALLFLTLASVSMRADSLRDGGRNVSVALFSAHAVQRITLAPLDATAWTSLCTGCDRHPLQNALHWSGTKELFAGGHLRIVDDLSHEQRSVTGLWHLKTTRDGIDVILTLPSERYVAAVLNAEANAAEPAASLQALAIVVRSYALNGRHYTAAPGHLAADLCDSTQCQAMRPGPVSKAIDDAVRQTAGETLWFHRKRAEVYFSENCGGLTEDVSSAWPALRGAPYLTSHRDPYCQRGGPSAWHAEVALSDFLSIAAAQHWHMPRAVDAASIVKRSSSHRPLLIQFAGGADRSTVDARALRFAIDRALGWNKVRSSQYDLAIRNSKLVFDGTGYGHGVGLCQAGATEMAVEHKSPRDILAFYFPGTSVGVGPDDNGWQTVRAGALSLRSTNTLTAGRLENIHQLWKQALQRFPPRKPLSPEIIFAPSTELFRQMTTQPGWVAASTSGSTIVVSPTSGGGHSGDATLLHEMLHVLIEAEAASQTPLWLREGLVAALMDERDTTSMAMRPEAIDEALRHPPSQVADKHAHQAAADRVHAMIARYGFSSVRGWLTAGVPAGAS